MKTLSFDTLLGYLKAPTCLLELPSEQWPELIFLLRHSRLLASLGEILTEQHIFDKLPAKVQFHLQSAMQYARRQGQQIAMESRAITQLLHANNIDCVYLKGASYVLNNWRAGAGRISSDIDVLVRESQLAEAETLLLKNLWRHQEITDYDDKYYREFAHEIPPLFHVQRGTVLDVHHNLFLPVSGRAPDIDSFWQNLSVTAQGHQVFLPHAAFVHSVIHLFLNEEVVYGCRDMVDLWRLLEEHGDERFIDGILGLCDANGFNNELVLVSQLLDQWFSSAKTAHLLAIVEATVRPKATFSNRKMRFWRRQYSLALIPHHPSIAGYREAMARLCVYVRGHAMKMPISVLVKHMVIKTHRGLLEWVTGNRDESRKQTLLGEGFAQQIDKQNKLMK